jgi:hypothetical protein
MKSKFFKDTQGLGECYTRCPPGQVCVCLRMDRDLYGQLLRQAGQCGMTSGQYIQQLMAWHGGACAGAETVITCPANPPEGYCPESLALTRQTRRETGCCHKWEQHP